MSTPQPECPEDETILFLLGESVDRYWATRERYNWRGAQIASWSVPVACCVRCRGEEVGTGGLQFWGTTHRQCWPEAE
jgi:hypothetical protein